ncbi:hypothetical protein FRC07_012761 [Ceratobasidium sp. 392]|nr:hypothetical protein FRC07_012761 [Ceratobasidium sp. 392]
MSMLAMVDRIGSPDRPWDTHEHTQHSHPTTTDLAEFHDLKDIFVTEGAITTKAGWDGIPKLHMLSHYAFLIREYGTPDGYNTELSERLHIDYVKIPYRASNKVDPIHQMITHLQRCEAWAVQRYRLEKAGLIKPDRRRLRRGEQELDDEDEEPTVNASEQEDDEDETREAHEHDQAQLTSTRKPKLNHTMPKYHPDPTLFIANKPTKSSVPAQEFIRRHEAPDFVNAVKRYVSQLPGGAEHARLLSEDFRFNIWARLSLVHDPLPFAPLVGGRSDLVRARPATAANGLTRRRPSAFDTVLMEVNPAAQGINREIIFFFAHASRN